MARKPKADEPVLFDASGRPVKSGQKTSVLTPRQRKAVKGIVEGKTIRQAAIDAGYSESVAGRGIAGFKSESVREVIRRIYTEEEFAAKIRAGCESMETKFFPSSITRMRKKDEQSGQMIEKEKREDPMKIDVINWSERRRYLQLLAKLAGFMQDAPSNRTDYDDQIMQIWTAGPVPPRSSPETVN